jgi:hypothetical protein
VDKQTISPAGDPFYAVAHHDEHHDDPHHDDHERPHACYEGVVYIGHLVEGADGDEEEVFEAVPCRRCLGNSR